MQLRHAAPPCGSAMRLRHRLRASGAGPQSSCTVVTVSGGPSSCAHPLTLVSHLSVDDGIVSEHFVLAEQFVPEAAGLRVKPEQSAKSACGHSTGAARSAVSGSRRAVRSGSQRALVLDISAQSARRTAAALVACSEWAVSGVRRNWNSALGSLRLSVTGAQPPYPSVPAVRSDSHLLCQFFRPVVL